MATRSPDLTQKTIAQLVSFFGNGVLTDKSQCSVELRQHLSDLAFDQLAEHARFCLDQKFDKSGYVLQDAVNEVGRRLGYQVTNGRYSGTTKEIGFDGLWFDGQRHLVIEVKTTDAYRINLDTIGDYAKRIRAEKALAEADAMTLIVVGRQDTGDLEAQVRGSRFAWSIRLISVDALLKLARLNESVDDPNLVAKIRRVVLPIEYTRVDNIIDLVFETQLETQIQAEISDDEKKLEATDTKPKSGKSFTPDLTPRPLLDKKRFDIVTAFFRSRNAEAQRQSRTNFEDPAKGLRVACAVSKRYERDYQPYWYAFHPAWLQFLEGGKEGYFILGGMDIDEAFAIPVSVVRQNLDNLNRTDKSGHYYWHVHLRKEDGSLVWHLSKTGTNVPLDRYRFSVKST